jgi:putative glycosyltransferase (TIGR04372 family)
MKKSYFLSQFDQIINNPFVLIPKVLRVLLFLPSSSLLLVVFLIRPIILIRIGKLTSSRLGHFAGNTELYLCERHSGFTPKRSFDFFYCEDRICNEYLYKMWARNLVIMPRFSSVFFIRVEQLINLFSYYFPLIKSHIVKPSLSDRDILGLMEDSPLNLKFTKDEVNKGHAELLKMGIPEEAKVVLLNVRDSAYLNSVDKNIDWTYHSYRDCDINNFFLVSEQMAQMGYYVIRIGLTTKTTFESNNPMVIDYANNGMRNDFMDIYLSSICDFIITTGSGGDALAISCFRKPVVYVNLCPIIDFPTFLSNSIAITKHHFSVKDNIELTFKEIISSNVGHCLQLECFEKNGVILIENTPEEICDVAIEMAKKLKGSWVAMNIDSKLQSTFWDIFPNTQLVNGEVRHGQIRMTYGSNFLRDNTWWLK